MSATGPLCAPWRVVTCMLVLGATLLVPCGTARALDNDLPISQFHHTAWTVKEGAPGQITALAQTQDGFLWLGTQQGLFRFDGVRFERYKPAGDAFPATSVAALYAPASGGLWIGFRYGAVSFLRSDTLTNYGEGQGLPSGSVYGFTEDHDGTVWAASFQGLVRLSGKLWKVVGPEFKYPGKQARAVFLDSAGTLWVATEDGLAILQRGNPEFKKLKIAVGRISQIAQASDGSIWIAEADGAIRAVMQADGQVGSGPELAFASAGLLFDRQGSLWATTLGDGVRRVRHPGGLQELPTRGAVEQVEVFREKDGLSADYLWPVLEDREGNIWFGTSRGLDRFRHGNLIPAEFPAGAYDFMLVAGDNGAIWSGSKNRPLMLLRDQRVTFEDLKPPITAAYRGPAGEVWLGGPAGIWQISSGKPSFLTTLPNAKRYSGVQAITRSADGALWVSLNTPGIYRWKDGLWTHIQDDVRMPSGSSPLTLLTDVEGRVWMGFARNEITLMQGEELNRITSRNGLEVGNVTALLQGRGRVWIGGERGLSFSDGRNMQTLRAPEGDPFRGISGLIETASGDLWLNGAIGVVQVSAEEIGKAISDHDYVVKFVLFDFLDGLPGTPAQFRPIPTAVEGSDGRLWFASTSGVVSVDPRRIMRNKLVPPVVIRSLRTDSKVYRASLKELRLPARAGNLQIDYTALSLSIPERVQFRYKLEGFEDEWQDVGTRRMAFYNNPGPGKYRFRVIASNNDGVWNEQGASLDFSIAPMFYQTHWFIVLYVIIGLGILWALYLFRMRQLASQIRARLHERHMERERIARELHDTLLQSIQGLILRFQAVAETIPPLDRVRIAMERGLERADQVLVEGRDRVLDLRASTKHPADLKELYTSIAEELSEDHFAHFRVVVTGVEQALDPFVLEELFRIGREALINAYHHSDAKNIEVYIIYSTEELCVQFKDNGRGVDAAVLAQGGREGHWGLSGMRERAERIGGHLSMRSRQGMGTDLEIRIPADAAYKPCLKESFHKSFFRKVWRILYRT